MNRHLRKLIARFRIEPLGVTMPGAGLPERIRSIIDSRSEARISRMRVACLIAACMTIGTASVGIMLTHAQSLYSFEVASVKPNTSGAQNDHLSFAVGRYTVTNTTAKNIIKFAFNMRDFQITGTPAWVDTDRFDIDATAGEQLTQQWHDLPRAQQIEDLRPMVQSLLANRFNMTVTHLVKELPVYALVVAGNGPALRPSAPLSGEQFRISGGPEGEAVLLAKNQPITALVTMLSQQLDHAVVDHSDLKGNYDFSLEWTPSLSSATAAAGQDDATADAPSIFTALRQQLGLRLESTKGPVDTIVVDHIEKPTPN